MIQKLSGDVIYMRTYVVGGNAEPFVAGGDGGVDQDHSRQQAISRPPGTLPKLLQGIGRWSRRVKHGLRVTKEDRYGVHGLRSRPVRIPTALVIGGRESRITDG